MTASALFVALSLFAGDSVPLYDNLGTYHHAISTKVPRTQLYFDQGLRLAYGFNHDEAIRAFREAARLDPSCAICWWGVAYSYGPNINLPMDSAAGANAWTAIEKAVELMENASPSERAYILATHKRYGAQPTAARAQRDSAYALAMRALARKYPADLDAATLAADAMMNLRPWNYWQKDGKPYPGTAELVADLEAVMRKNRDHPGACHLYIHAVEATHPEKAVACAERLASLMPGAGHIVHMPAHIYIRVGRWNDAIEANHHALHADEQYIAAEKPAGIYPLSYYPHNHHFLAFAASMAGRGDLALEHARAAAAKTPADAAQAFTVLQPIVAYPFLASVTFGRWSELVAAELPPANLRIANALAAYAKGVAHAALGRPDAARVYLDTLMTIAAQTTPEAGGVDAILDVAQHALMGEMAHRANDLDGAAQHFRVAMRLEDQMIYIEPPDWYYPIRQSLGAVLLDQGKAAEAEALYRADLAKFAENVWSLKGLSLALEAQGKTAEAASVKARLAKATSMSDAKLLKSRL